MHHSSRQLANGIAFAKAVAVAVMIFAHCSVWLVTKEDVSLLADNFLAPLIKRFALLGVFPLMLPALAGGSFYAHLRRGSAAPHRAKY